MTSSTKNSSLTPVIRTPIEQNFETNKKGQLQLRTGFMRFIATVNPFYRSSKTEEAAKEMLCQLKESYNADRFGETKRKVEEIQTQVDLATQVLKLKPSERTAKEIKAYVTAIVLANDQGVEDVIANTYLDLAVTDEKALAFSKQLENLGLSVENQRRYPDLVKMIRENELADYMEGANWKVEHGGWAAEYGEGEGKRFQGTPMRFDSNNNWYWGEPVIPVNGKPMPWSEARKKIFGKVVTPAGWDNHQEAIMSKNEKNPHLELDVLRPSWKLPKEWRFDSQGISNICTYDWDNHEFEPCGTEANHDGKYYYDFMSYKDGLNHCWVRLVDKDGKVYSAGLSGKINTYGMLRGSVGRINGPDHREFFKPINHRQTRICISEKDFLTLKNGIEEEQATKNLYFNLLTRNCAKWACEITSRLGLHINNSEFPTQLIMRNFFKRFKIRPNETLVIVMNKVSYVGRLIRGTIASFFMGAWYQNPNVAVLEREHGHKWKNKPVKPFRSFISLFDGSSGRMSSSSFKIAEWQEYVELYRKTRLDYLNTRLMELIESDAELCQTENFQEAWNDLVHRVEFEMPYGISDTHLFMKELQPISTEDLGAEVLALKVNVAGGRLHVIAREYTDYPFIQRDYPVESSVRPSNYILYVNGGMAERVLAK